MEKLTIQSKNEAILGGKIIVGFYCALLFLGMLSLFIGDKKLDLREREGMLGFLYFLFIFAIVNGIFLIEEVLSKYRKIILDRDGCTISWFGFTKRHKWEDLQVIREDCWVSKKKEYEGIVFSTKVNKQKKSSRKIYESYDFLNCFYVIFYIDDHKSYEYPAKYDEFTEQLKKWGVEIEVGREVILKKRRQYTLEMGMKRRKYRIEREKKRKNKLFVKMELG